MFDHDPGLPYLPDLAHARNRKNAPQGQVWGRGHGRNFNLLRELLLRMLRTSLLLRVMLLLEVPDPLLRRRSQGGGGLRGSRGGEGGRWSVNLGRVIQEGVPDTPCSRSMLRHLLLWKSRNNRLLRLLRLGERPPVPPSSDSHSHARSVSWWLMLGSWGLGRGARRPEVGDGGGG